MHLQVIQYMRTDVTVGGMAALAVVLTDLAFLTYPVSLIRKAVTSERYSQSAIAKDFLQPGVHSTTVRRGDQSRRRRLTTNIHSFSSVTCWT